MKKYSENFERDYDWYLKYRDTFNFDGSGDYTNKKGEPLIQTDYNHGKRAKDCFWSFDSNGKILPTCEPVLLFKILKCKGSINFNIKMWAEDRANGYLPYIEFEEIIKEFELLPWMVDAVENQAFKYRKQKYINDER